MQELLRSHATPSGNASSAASADDQSSTSEEDTETANSRLVFDEEDEEYPLYIVAGKGAAGVTASKSEEETN